MDLSLIVTTYNWKQSLALVLQSAFRQTEPPAEIIVADDGSSDGTDLLISSLKKATPVPLLHSFQEDRGFRAAASRNRAIAMARGEYIVLIDGDMLLERHFLADHRQAARHGWFVQGCRVLIDEETTGGIFSSGEIPALSFWSQGIENRKNTLRSPLLSRLFSWPDNGLSGIRTCNFAFFRKDALAVNGFNEDFTGWGREDSEFAARLLHNDVRRRNLRFSAAAYHLHHKSNSRGRLPANDEILARTISQRLAWCENGIDKHLATSSPLP